jgi:hypothetical protein
MACFALPPSLHRVFDLVTPTELVPAVLARFTQVEHVPGELLVAGDVDLGLRLANP